MCGKKGFYDLQLKYAKNAYNMRLKICMDSHKEIAESLYQLSYSFYCLNDEEAMLSNKLAYEKEITKII